MIAIWKSLCVFTIIFLQNYVVKTTEMLDRLKDFLFILLIQENIVAMICIVELVYKNGVTEVCYTSYNLTLWVTCWGLFSISL